jgi:Uma2 family endonuclease
MAVLKRDTDYHTYSDYLTWSRDYGDELIDGTAYVREPPSASQSHQQLVLEIGRQLGNALEDKPCDVYVAPFDVRLPKSTEDDDLINTVVQPDVLIVSDRKKVDARGVRGAPDWVAEILSPSTARHDQTVKLSAYERAGVREVWLVDSIDRKLTIYRLEAGHYGHPTILDLKGRTQLTAVPGISIDWTKVLAKMS